MLRETMEHEEKRRGDDLPDTLNRIKDFQKYVESYDVLRENELVRVETRITYRTGDVIGLAEIFSGSYKRSSLIRSLGPCKLLFIGLKSLKRHGNLQEKVKKKLFENRRR